MTEHTPMPAAIAAAIVAVMAEIPRLNKTETNTHGNYSFAGIDAFLDAVRPLCAKHGLIIIQDEDSFTSADGWLTMRFAFTLAHSSGETWAVRPIRTALVNGKMGSQALGAAQSYALKMFMRSLFQISTGEKGQDIDEHPASNLPTATNPKPETTFADWKAFGYVKTKAADELRALGRMIRDDDATPDELTLDAHLVDAQPLIEAVQQCSDWWPDVEDRLEERRQVLQTRVFNPLDGA